MKNKVYILILLLISFICFKIKTYAASSATPDQGSHYTEMQTEYNKGIEKTNITSSGMVTIYGKTECNDDSCDYQYVGNTKDFKEVLSKSVVCTGGEKYISLGTSATGGNKEEFENLNGTAYWSEDYNVTCVNESSGDKTVELNNSNSSSGGSSSSGGTSTGGSSSSGGTSTGGSSSSGETSTGGTSTGDSSGDGEYDSSDTTDTSQTGVSTYFVVLSVVAIISYVFMMIVKKYNLFKRI